MDCRRIKAVGITYRWGIWKAIDDGSGLNKGGEPLRRIPVAVTRTRRLIDSSDDGTETRLRSGELEETFGDPFRLTVTVT